MKQISVFIITSYFLLFFSPNVHSADLSFMASDEYQQAKKIGYIFSKYGQRLEFSSSSQEEKIYGQQAMVKMAELWADNFRGYCSEFNKKYIEFANQLDPDKKIELLARNKFNNDFDGVENRCKDFNTHQELFLNSSYDANKRIPFLLKSLRSSLERAKSSDFMVRKLLADRSASMAQTFTDSLIEVKNMINVYEHLKKSNKTEEWEKRMNLIESELDDLRNSKKEVLIKYFKLPSDIYKMNNGNSLRNEISKILSLKTGIKNLNIILYGSDLDKNNFKITSAQTGEIYSAIAFYAVSSGTEKNIYYGWYEINELGEGSVYLSETQKHYMALNKNHSMSKSKITDSVRSSGKDGIDVILNAREKNVQLQVKNELESRKINSNISKKKIAIIFG